MWQSRSRLNSARTMSESSEGRGTVVELEMNEDFSLTGSLRRKRQREDSAYMSQGDNMSGSPLDTENEEEHNGYVLPGESPERDTLLSVSRDTPFRERTRIVHSSGLSDDPDDEEYEYMNKQAASLPNKQDLRDDAPWPKMKDRGGHATDGDKGAGHNSDSEDQAFSEVEYECMDVRGCEAEENAPATTREAPGPSALIQEHPGTRGGFEAVEDDYYPEDNNYQYTNKQPKLRQALRDKTELKVQRKGVNGAYEYEEMSSFAAQGGGDDAVYQNVQGEEEDAAGGADARRSRAEPHVEAYARVKVAEPGGGDSSFDNPDYWHSRMFLKPKAVRT